MTKAEVTLLRQRISFANYYGDRSKEELLSFEYEINIFIDYVQKQNPPQISQYTGSIQQLGESTISLKTCHKSSVESEFRECKADYLSVLDDFINLADKHDLWKK